MANVTPEVSKNLTVFLLEPVVEKEQHEKVLIWSNNEREARANAERTTSGFTGGTTGTMAGSTAGFYQNTQKASCKLLGTSDFKVISNGGNILNITYKNKSYELHKNEPETIQ
jgi:hypothetical protein